MTELVSIVPAIEISTDTIVEIETALPNLQVNTSESITVEVQPDTYVLSSAGMYTGNMTGKIPTWILDAIQEQLTTGDGNIASVLDDIQLLLEGLQLGVNQTISQIENTNTSMSALETSLSSRIDANNAAILDVYATKVTATEAQALAVQAIGATFGGNVDAYIGNLASVYTSPGSAIATNISTLQASYNDQTARIDTVEEVSIFKNATIRSAIAPTLVSHPLLVIGDLWINTSNNIVKSWDGLGWVDTTNAVADSAQAKANTSLAKLADLEETRDGVVNTYYMTTAPVNGMSYGDYWIDTDSWSETAYVIYRYEAVDGSSVGTLAWRINTGETAVTLGKAYRADVLAGTAQATADGKIKTWYQNTAPVLTASDIGDIWVETDNANKLQVWSGTAWADPTSAQGTTAYTWSANASKLITAPDGSVTGWSFGDGSNTKSNFKIKAQNFSISDGTTGYTPFSITGSDINFLGKVSFSSVAGAPYGGSNLLYNSAPMLANETKGWSVGWYNTVITPTLGAGYGSWRPSGGGSVYAVVPGVPTVGTVFDVAQTTKVPVIGGTWYEASAYASSHRCTSYVTIAWFDSNNTYIHEVGGSQIAVAASGALSNWSRSTLLAQAPANAARALFYVRSSVSGTDPYCFVAFAYLGKAVQGQAVFSDWSEGTSAGVSSGEVVNDINNGNTTTINGGRITTGSITAEQINASNLIAHNIMSSSVILGNRIEGSLIQGARIEGAVIKASYLDLDGDLELLTDYHITPAMYANNPSMYTDAIPLSGEYRLPTISTVSTEPASTTLAIADSTNYYTLLAGMHLLRNNTYTTNIFGYNQCAVNSNRKYRRARPYVTIAETKIYESFIHVTYMNNPGDMSDDRSSGAYHDLYVYFGDVLLLHLYGGSAGTSGGVQDIPAIYANGVLVVPANTWFYDSRDVNVVSNGFTFTISSSASMIYYTPVSYISVSMQATTTNMLVPFDVNGPFRIVVGPNTFVNRYDVTTPQIIVNNML